MAERYLTKILIPECTGKIEALKRSGGTPDVTEKDVLSKDAEKKLGDQLQRQADKILSKSTLTEADAIDIGRKIKRDIAKRHGLYKKEDTDVSQPLRISGKVLELGTMRFTSSGIELDRELSDLDRFALDFIKILQRHTSYVLVSGYVAILLGRARASEDVDVIISRLPPTATTALHADLVAGGFESLTADAREFGTYLSDGIPVRFARKGTVIPNAEVKQAKNRFDDLALTDAMTMKLPVGSLRISPLELQIAFKEAVLKSPKDIEDSQHLRAIATGHLEEKRIQQLKEQLHDFFYPGE